MRYLFELQLELHLLFLKQNLYFSEILITIYVAKSLWFVIKSDLKKVYFEIFINIIKKSFIHIW